MREVALSYQGPHGGKGYIGLFALPGDPHWRQCQDRDGPVYHPTPAQAEADAAHRLVAALRREIAHA